MFLDSLLACTSSPLLMFERAIFMCGQLDQCLSVQAYPRCPIGFNRVYTRRVSYFMAAM